MAEVVTVNKLKPLIDRLERLGQEEDQIKEMKKEVLAEAKNEGFDVAAIRKVLADRKKDTQKISEFEETVQLYRDAIS